MLVALQSKNNIPLGMTQRDFVWLYVGESSDFLIFVSIPNNTKPNGNVRT